MTHDEPSESFIFGATKKEEDVSRSLEAPLMENLALKIVHVIVGNVRMVSSKKVYFSWSFVALFFLPGSRTDFR